MHRLASPHAFEAATAAAPVPDVARAGRGRRLRRRAAAAWFALAATLGPQAAHAEALTQWSCWLSQSHQDIACLLEQANALQPATDRHDAAAADTAAAAARMDPRLPPIVRSMRLAPQAWRAKVVFIPLHGVAFDDSPLEPLAQAVLCGPLPHCQARVVKDPADQGMRFVAMLADANDPLLAD